MSLPLGQSKILPCKSSTYRVALCILSSIYKRVSLAGQFINLSSSWQYEEEVPSPGIYYIGYAIAPSGSNIGNISG